MKKIKLTQGKYALVDDCDFEWLNKWKWFYGNGGYAARNSPTVNGKRKAIYMHRVIMKTPEGEETDHKDMNGINNQRGNLRTCTKSQNCMNRRRYKNSISKYKGVSWKKETGRWGASIKFNQKQLHIGYFTCEEKAGKAYDKLAKELFGEFAYLNFK